MTESTGSTPRKRTTRTKKEPVKTVEETVETPVKEMKRKKQIDLNIQVPCRNVTDGELIYISKKTGLEVLWSAYGDEEYIDVAELLTMKSSQPRFMNEPWLVVEDEDVVEYLGLNKLYEKLVDVDDLDSFFERPTSEMDEILAKIPKGTKNSIAVRARKKIKDQTLYDIRKIELLEDKLKIDLSILL